MSGAVPSVLSRFASADASCAFLEFLNHDVAAHDGCGAEVDETCIQTYVAVELGSEHHASVVALALELAEGLHAVLIGLCVEVALRVDVLLLEAQVFAYLIWNLGQVVHGQFVAEAEVSVGIDGCPHGKLVGALAECEIYVCHAAALVLLRFAYVDVPLGRLVVDAVVAPGDAEVHVDLDAGAEVSAALLVGILLAVAVGVLVLLVVVLALGIEFVETDILLRDILQLGEGFRAHEFAELFVHVGLAVEGHVNVEIFLLLVAEIGDCGAGIDESLLLVLAQDGVDVGADADGREAVVESVVEHGELSARSDGVLSAATHVESYHAAHHAVALDDVVSREVGAEVLLAAVHVEAAAQARDAYGLNSAERR